MEEVVIINPTTVIPADSVVLQKQNRSRNFSFQHKEVEALDTVECNGVVYPIPAAFGSSYWAILKTVFAKFGQPVYHEELVNNVELLMKDQNPEKWNKYISKEKTTVYLKADHKAIKKDIQSWSSRIICNAKTLTRLKGNSPYGKRLQERGFKLSYCRDVDKKYYFIVSADTAV